MMNKKFLTMMFSLLLAVGWTSDASAQQLPPKRIKTKTVSQANVPLVNGETVKPKFGFAEFNNGQRHNAPKRTQNYTSTAPITHTKAWYEQQVPVTWGSNSAPLTARFTDPDGMIALLKRVYTDKNIPGIKHSDAKSSILDGVDGNGNDVPYQTIEYGWNIIGTEYPDDLTIVAWTGVAFYEILVEDPQGNTLAHWIAPQYGSNPSLPTGWTASSNLTRYTAQVPNGETDWWGNPEYDTYYTYYLSSNGTITIPASDLSNSYGYVNVKIAAISRYQSPTQDNSLLAAGNDTHNYSIFTVSENDDIYYYGYDGILTSIPGEISTPPDDNGYTVMMVKLKDGVNDTVSVRAPMYTADETELHDYFSTYIKEIQLLTDGMRVGGNTDKAGTVFAYTGDLNRFFFISKGKMYYLSSLNHIGYDRAPFYSMYEEFSPYTTRDTLGSADFYDRMKKGESYPVVHDCNSVSFMQHYFSMSGKKGTSENAVSSLVFYIPDKRGFEDSTRNYHAEHRPEVGLYLITLNAEAQPSTQQEHYTVTVTWESNLNDITSNTIAQSYRLWEIITAPDGTVTTREITSMLSDVHDTSLTYDVPQYDDSYTITYYVIGTPDDATNKDTFFAKSNEKDVIIPGLNDFIGLSMKRYECDYDVENQLNYYRNFLSPKNLEYLGTQGVTKAYVGSDGKTLVLYRNDEPVGYLDLKMDGDKCYYRFRYLDQQIEPGYGPDGNKTTTNSSNN